MIRKLKIGNVELENNILLAPMAGITDLSFRNLCKKYGAGLVCTEMASAKAMYYGDEKTKKLIQTSNKERPIAIQIFGSEIESLKYATQYLNDIADIIDINMGCPAPKVVKNGDGSKLLLDLKLIEEIVRAVVNVAKVPVTVKIRKGWNEENIVAIEAAKIIESSGASAITIHGRTREEFYSGKADWNIIKQVKEQVKIPVIGNGDIIDGKTAKEIFEKTNVDGIMIGRGALGRPWLFKQIIDYLEGKTEEKISKEEILENILEHLEQEILQKGEQTAVKEMRKHIAWYIKGMPEATFLRQEINKIEEKEELENTIKEYFNKI